jgi:two-component system phosphate regulon response regulator PhoB
MHTFGPIRVDFEAHALFVEAHEVQVSPLEMRLLAYLMANPGQVRSLGELLSNVWGYKQGTRTRTIQTHIKRLRDKLGEAGKLIETVRGAGYRLSETHTPPTYG